MKRISALAVLLALIVLTATSAAKKDVIPVGKRAEALSSWDGSVWLSAANAPVVTTRVTAREGLAADGASWFVSTVTNEKDVVSARWMTAGLGVYDLYLNGQLVGEEILKPGFTLVRKV